MKITTKRNQETPEVVIRENVEAGFICCILLCNSKPHWQPYMSEYVVKKEFSEPINQIKLIDTFIFGFKSVLRYMVRDLSRILRLTQCPIPHWPKIQPILSYKSE